MIDVPVSTWRFQFDCLCKYTKLEVSSGNSIREKKKKEQK